MILYLGLYLMNREYERNSLILIISFSDALRVNLQRAIILQRVNISMESQDIQVNYTNETGPSWFGNKLFRYLDHIKRTTVFIDNSGLNTSFSFIKAYGWVPGHSKYGIIFFLFCCFYTNQDFTLILPLLLYLASFLDDCSIIIANLALHYNAGTMKIGDYNAMCGFGTYC